MVGLISGFFTADDLSATASWREAAAVSDLGTTAVGSVDLVIVVDGGTWLESDILFFLDCIALAKCLGLSVHFISFTS